MNYEPNATYPNAQEWTESLATRYESARKLDGSLASGVCDNDTKCIYINENLNSSLMKRVLCHEITHAAMFSYETDLTVEQEELLADLIATYGQEIISKTNDIFQ